MTAGDSLVSEYRSTQSGLALAKHTWLRVLRYIFTRLVVLGVTLFIGVYAAVIVANLGGFIDQYVRANIDNAIMGMARAGAFNDIPFDEREQYVNDLTYRMEEAAGLYQPFWLRCLRWAGQYLSLNFSDTAVVKALPNTLLLFGTGNLLLLFSGLGLALYLSRHYGNWLDRLVVVLSPVSSIPSWVYGAFLIVVFTNLLHFFPATGMVDLNAILAEPSWKIRLVYLGIVVRHLALPVLALFLSMFFQVVYTWRTFFLIHSGDDHVEVAKAKGLSSKVVERHYILRPALPYILTNLALILIGFWQTSLALEYIFYWPGIGKLYIDSVGVVGYRTPVIMAIVTIFAYLLVLTVFILDVVYVLVDPRLRLGEQSQSSPVQVWRAGWSGFRRRLRNRSRRIDKQESLRPLRDGLPDRPRMADDIPKFTPVRHHQTPWQAFWRAARVIFYYPSAVVGLLLIVGLVATSVYAVIAIPYQQAVNLWVKDNHLDKPETAPPTWVNWFRREKLPETIFLDSQEMPQVKTVKSINEDINDIALSFKFNYPYTGGFPQDVVITFAPQYAEKRPYIELAWFTPDGREIDLGSHSLTEGTVFRASQDTRLRRLYGERDAHFYLFIDPANELAGQPLRPLTGQYELRISAVTFEAASDLDASVRLYGQVYGWAGTDHRRRDLGLALLWGAPIALGLGLLGAVCSSLAAMLLAATGVWFGGWVDGLIQAITEVNAALPVFPLAIMAYFLYGKNVWLTLGIIILFSIFGSAIKSYRAAFLQVKQSPYIEAALAYGVGNWRMIFFYLLPRIVPVLIPQLVAMVPGYVFLEATLAILRVSDPYLPTWGKMLYDALTNRALYEHYYWVLEPLVLLMLTGIAFALLGFALDRIFNPRLRNL